MSNKQFLKKIFSNALKWCLLIIAGLFGSISIPFIGIFVYIIPGAYLEVIENVFGFIDLTVDNGGYFNFQMPNLFGLILLGIMIFLACLWVALIRLNKKHLSRNHLVLLSFAFVIFFAVFILIIPVINGMRHSPEKCRLMFDGQHKLNKSECYYRSAVLNKTPINLNYCNSKVKQADNQYYNYHARCLSLLAKQNNDINFCNQIQIIDTSSQYQKSNTLGTKQNCYQEVSKYETVTCEDIDLLESRERCYSTRAYDDLNLTSCDKLSAKQDIDDCYMKIIKVNKDVSSCSKLSSKELIKECQGFAVYRDELISFSIPPGVTIYRYSSFKDEKYDLCSHISLYGYNEVDFYANIRICKNRGGNQKDNTESVYKIDLESVDYEIETKEYLRSSTVESRYLFSDEDAKINLFYRGKEDSAGRDLFENILFNINFIN